MASSAIGSFSVVDLAMQQKQAIRGALRTSNSGTKSKTLTRSPGNSDSESDADEEDNSSDGDADDEDISEADALALSDQHMWHATHGKQSLAGLESEEMFQESPQTIAGASPESGDSDDYAGVEDISEDEGSGAEGGDLKNVRLAAEQDLIEEFEGLEEKRNADSMTSEMDEMLLADDDPFTPRRNVFSSGNLLDDFNEGLDMNMDPFGGLAMDSSAYQELSWEAEAEFVDEAHNHDSAESTETKKRVRFIEPPSQQAMSRSSSMSSVEDPNELYPDLFDAQGDHLLAQNIAVEMYQQDFDDAASCYDFDGEEEAMAFAIDQEESDSSEEESDFDSDEGDTTDEESDEEPLASVRAASKAIAKSPKITPSTPTPTKRDGPRRSSSTPASTPRSGKGPRMGTFVVDKNRACMSAGGEGNKMKMMPPAKPSERDRAFWARYNTANSSRSSTPRSSAVLTARTPGPEELASRPFTAQSTLATMFDGKMDMIRNDNPPMGNAMLPPPLPRHHTSFSSGTLEDDSDEEMGEVDMHEFLDLDDSGSESDDVAASQLTSPTSSSTFDSFRPMSAHSNHTVSSGLLDHLEQQRGLVGSFRRNQNFAKQVSSLASHPASRASTSEYNALQKGRRGAGNTPITPARKRPTSQDLGLTGAGVRKAVGSPLATRRPRSRGSSLSQTLSPDLQRELQKHT